MAVGEAGTTPNHLYVTWIMKKIADFFTIFWKTGGIVKKSAIFYTIFLAIPIFIVATSGARIPRNSPRFYTLRPNKNPTYRFCGCGQIYFQNILGCPKIPPYLVRGIPYGRYKRLQTGYLYSP